MLINITKRIMLTFAIVMLVTQGAHAEGNISIKIIDLPNNLRLPLAKGTNQLLTAKIKGGEVKSAWLAVSQESAGRINLTRVDEQEFQINLADPMVSAILISSQSKQFYIFAETADQKISASIPIQFSTYPPVVQTSDSTAYVKHGNKRTKLKYRYKEYWFNPAEVDVLEVEFTPAQSNVTSSIEIDERPWRFKTTQRPGLLQLKMTPEIKKAWKEFGRLELSSSSFENTPIKISATPELKFEKIPEVMTVFQRRSATLPGSNNYLRLHLRDITAGQVMVSLQNTHNYKDMVKQHSMKQGDFFDFKYEGEEYRISLVSLVNILFSSDYAVFLYSPKNLDEAQKIEFLLKALANTNFRLSKNNKDYSSVVVASNLREEFKIKENSIKTMQEFLSKIESQKSEQKYVIKNTDGSTTELISWFKNIASLFIASGS